MLFFLAVSNILTKLFLSLISYNNLKRSSHATSVCTYHPATSLSQRSNSFSCITRILCTIAIFVLRNIHIAQHFNIIKTWFDREMEQKQYRYQIPSRVEAPCSNNKISLRITIFHQNTTMILKLLT